MLLFRAAASVVRRELELGRLVPTLHRQFQQQMGCSPSLSEERSWERSLARLSDDLVTAGRGEVEMLLEYRMPYSSMRVDAVLCGQDRETRAPMYCVVELKQWKQAVPVEGTDNVVLGDSGSQLRLHPVVQAQRYCEFLADYVVALGGSTDRLRAVAYLHDAKDAGVAGLFEQPDDEGGWLFTGEGREDFHAFLRTTFAEAPGEAAADALVESPVRPSKQLLALAAEEVQRREKFVLLGEQEVARSLVLAAVDRAGGAAQKEVVIVTGGPGSGKSVIALSLMGDLARRGRSVLHATGSSAFTQTLRKVAGDRAPRVKKMFTYYNQFIDAEVDGLDVLINDEAHRIKETSTNRWTPAKKRTGRPQVEELIDAARVPVFLLDEHQVVRPGERGTVAEIRDAATRMGCAVHEVDLDAQFRCGGSRAYENWVLRLLGLEEGGPVVWTGDDGFELTVSEGPSQMEASLRSLLGGNFSARIAAGYCWDWKKPTAYGLAPDVQIGSWHRPWNNPDEKTAVDGSPARSYWALDDAGFGQVGCIYTAQGFEYDYSGVIFGPDLVWRTDRWVAQPEYSHDNQVRRAALPDFDRAVRNTYKVLLTRGMRGSTLFSTDPETQAFLRSLVES